MNRWVALFMGFNIIVFVALMGGWAYFNIDLPGLSKGEDSSVKVPVRATYEDKIVYTTDMDSDSEDFKNDCKERGGTFDLCGSICARDAEFCADVCAYVCYLNNTDTKATSTPKSPVNNIISSVLNTQEKLLSWKKFMSSGLGFSIENRSDMDIEERPTEAKVSFLLNGNSQSEDSSLSDGMKITIAKRTYNGDLESFAKNEINGLETFGKITREPTQVKINNISGLNYSVSSSGNYDFYLIPQNERYVFIITVQYSDPHSKGYNVLAGQMLDSFNLLFTT